MHNFQRCVGRFAPTPSGRMHLGNAMCALIAYLSAKSRGGKFLLRIEDLDAERCPRRFAEDIMRDLERLGIFWEGEVLFQSERAEVYREYFDRLRTSVRVYPCFCSRAALHAAEAPHLSDGSVIYPGTCRSLSPEEISAKEKCRPPAWRVQVPAEGENAGKENTAEENAAEENTEEKGAGKENGDGRFGTEYGDGYRVAYLDGLRGVCSQNLSRECGDFVLRRADGVFAYQLAVVVDDALSGVTEVVRGEDLRSSAARQVWLYRLLGFEPPVFYHIPLLTDRFGRRLAKREGDSLSDALETYSPRQIVGALAFAAGIIEEPVPVSPEELIKIFDWKKIGAENRGTWRVDFSGFGEQ